MFAWCGLFYFYLSYIRYKHLVFYQQHPWFLLLISPVVVQVNQKITKFLLNPFNLSQDIITDT